MAHAPIFPRVKWDKLRQTEAGFPAADLAPSTDETHPAFGNARCSAPQPAVKRQGEVGLQVAPR